MIPSIELSEFGTKTREGLREVPAVLLSQIADQMITKSSPPRILDLEYECPDGGCMSGRDMGSGLTRGVIRIRFAQKSPKKKKVQATKAILGGVTGYEMTGGLLWIEGNVERICNVHGGNIVVMGNVEELVNIHKGAVILCAGEIGAHLYAADSAPDVGPSEHIFCSSAPSNDISGPASNWRAERSASSNISFVRIGSDTKLLQLNEKKDFDTTLGKLLEAIKMLLDGQISPRERLEILREKLGIKRL